MGISIEIHSYKKAIASVRHDSIKAVISSVITASKKLEKVDVYDFATSRQTHESNQTRLFIFGNSTHDKAESESLVIPSPVKLFGIDNTVTSFLPIHGQGLVIVEEGIAVAEFFPQRNVLNITFDIFNQTIAVSRLLLTKILEVINAEYDKANLLMSWKFTSNKDSLIQSMLSRVTAKAEERRREAKQNADHYKTEAEQKKRQLTQALQNLQRYMKEADQADAGVTGIKEKYLADFDLMIGHPKIADVRFVDGLIEVYTNQLYIYDEDGNKYIGSKYKITINMDRTEVRFFGDNPRRSYWSHNDPHPHVSGNDNHACLGNVSSTIAELVAYNEVYALALTCIDFLESVNTDDAAGKYIINWDMVDEEDNTIQKGRVDAHPDDDESDDEDESDDDEDNDEDGEDLF